MNFTKCSKKCDKSTAIFFWKNLLTKNFFVIKQVSSYFETVDIDATVKQVEAITEEQLKVLVEECAPYLDTAEMQYAELVETIIESRNETATFFSQEIKDAYYEAKECAMQQAEIVWWKLETRGFGLSNILYTCAHTRVYINYGSKLRKKRV